MPGTWRRFYRRWAELTLERIDPGLLNLVPRLARLVPPALTIDKRVYSPFSEQTIWQVLRERQTDTLVITGAETDARACRGVGRGGLRVPGRARDRRDLQLVGPHARGADDALLPSVQPADRDRQQRGDHRRLAPDRSRAIASALNAGEMAPEPAPINQDVQTAQLPRHFADRAVHLLLAGHYQWVRTGRLAIATGPIETVIDEDLIDDFNVKYVGALRCSRAVLPFMESAGWRRIINLMGLCTYEATLYACAQDLQGRKLDEPQRRPPVGGEPRSA